MSGQEDVNLLKQLYENGFISEVEYQARLRGPTSPPNKAVPKRSNRGAMNLSAVSLDLPPAEEIVPPLRTLNRSAGDVNALDPEVDRRRSRSGGAQQVPSPAPPKYSTQPLSSLVGSASNIPAVEGFLKSIGMGEFLPVFLTHGFNNLEKIKGLKESDLSTLTITNMAQRRSLLQAAKTADRTVATQSSVPKPAQVTELQGLLYKQGEKGLGKKKLKLR